MPDSEIQVAPTTDVATQNPMAFIQQATANGAPVETLEKLMDLNDRWEASNARKAFFQAMAEFQVECPVIPKNGRVHNKQGKLVYTFPKLEDVIRCIREVEMRHGFRHRWTQEESDTAGVKIACHITHIQGHEEITTVTIPPTKGMNTNAAQDQGLVIAYGKRYSLLNAYGLESSDDNDARPISEEKITENQAMAIGELMDQLPANRQADFRKWLGVDSIDDIPAPKYQQAMNSLKKVVADEVG